MAADASNFIEAQNKYVDKGSPSGSWQVYPSYKLWWYKEEHGGEVQHFPFFEAAPVPWVGEPMPEGTPAHQAGYKVQVVPERSTVDLYAPLRVDDLFVQFANLFGDGRVDPFAPETIQRVGSWVEGYGVLGRHGTYPTPEGGMVTGRCDRREEVMVFVRLAVEANRSLQLFSAATEPGGANAEKLRDLGVTDGTTDEMKRQAMTEIVATVDKHLENETFTRLYSDKDGKLHREPGFCSLLGALWLQMSNFVIATQGDITRCRWCGDIIALERKGEPPPSDAPRGTRGKHKTHKNRVFCKEKQGVKDRCKNQWHHDRRKGLVALAAEDGRGRVHMRDGRPEEWSELTNAEKGVYDKAYRETPSSYIRGRAYDPNLDSDINYPGRGTSWTASGYPSKIKRGLTP